MFHMILVLVSIALVAALAVATLWHGGEAMSAGNIRAAATATVNQGQQIAVATRNFATAKNARLPTSIAELVTEGFLGSVPIGDRVFTGGAWYFFTSGNQRFAAIQIDETTGEVDQFCTQINVRSSGGNLPVPQPSFSDAQVFPFFCAVDSGVLIFFYRM